MPVTDYHTVNGRIRGESTGGVRTDYLSDALGSVVATVNSSAQVVNTYRYKPYGARLAKAGAGADPAFQWSGTFRYRTADRDYAEIAYVNGVYSSILGSFPSFGLSGPSSRGSSWLLGKTGQTVPTCGLDPGFRWHELILNAIFIREHRHEPNTTPCTFTKFLTFWKRDSGVYTGAVIQKVDMHLEVDDCKTRSPGDYTWDSHYIEAWNINQGVIEIGGYDLFQTEDAQRIIGQNNIDCPNVTASTLGFAGIVDGCHAAGPTWSRIAVPESGGLFAIRGVPGQLGVGPTRKKLFYKSNCCVTLPGYTSTAVSTHDPFSSTLGPGSRGTLRPECAPTCE